MPPPCPSLTAIQMHAVEFAHQQEKSKQCPVQIGACARGSNFQFAFNKYRKCESKCSFCHVLEGETLEQRKERLARTAT